ncbi:unnamed protein product, partial [Prorocentrum cordatum]
DAHSIFELKEFLMIGLGFTVPCHSDSHFGVGDQFAFAKHRSDLIELLDEPMSGTIVLRRQLAAAATARPQHEKEKDEPSSKRRRVNHQKMALAIVSATKEESVRMRGDTDGATRPLVIFDDMAWLAFGSLDQVSKSKIDMELVRKVIAACFKFVFYKSTSFDGEVFDKYSDMRKALHAKIVEAHLTDIAAVRFPKDDKNTGADPTKVDDVLSLCESNRAKSVNETAAVESVGAAPAVPVKSRSELLADFAKEAQQCQGWIFDLYESKNCCKDTFPRATEDIKSWAGKQQTLLMANVGVVSQLGRPADAKKISLGQLASIAANKFIDMHNEPANVYVAMLAKLYRESVDSTSAESKVAATKLYDQLTIAFDDDGTEYRDLVVNMVNQRNLYIIEVIRFNGAGVNRYTELDAAEYVSKLRVVQASGALGVVDMCLKRSHYESGWATIMGVIASVADVSKHDEVGQTLCASLLSKGFLDPICGVLMGVAANSLKATEVQDSVDSVAVESTAESQVPESLPSVAATPPPKASTTDLTKNTPDDKHPQDHVVAISSVRARAIPDLEGPLCRLYHFAKFLESHIWAITQLSNQMRLGGVSPDTPLDKIYMDETGAGKKIWLKTPVKNVCLNYVGNVSMMPTVGSVWVAKFWGVDFYVNGHGFRDL